VQSFVHRLRWLAWLVCISLALSITGVAQDISPAGTKPTAASPAPAGQAPDDVMKKLSELVHQGKYAEAQQTVAALLILYPDDQRLIKTKALLDKSLASSKPADPTPNSNPPASNVAPVLPAMGTTATQLTGMEKVEFNSLMELARRAQQTTDLDQQKQLLIKFMTVSGPFLVKHPDEILLWQLRAASALSLNDAIAGFEAGQKLLAAGAADSNDPNVQHLLAQLNLEGWLDKKKAEKRAEIKEKEKRFAWLLGTWDVNWTWLWGINGRDQEQFVASDSGIEGYLIFGNGLRNAEPDFRGTILDSGEIKWECYLPPSDTGGFYVFRHISGSVFLKITVGRRSDPHGYFGNGDNDTGDLQFYPSGWQPVLSYAFDKDKRTMTIVIPPQEADAKSTFSKKKPVTLSFNKAGSAQNQQVQSQELK
jgi:hypothetical protein